jgi:hypothetical protein
MTIVINRQNLKKNPKILSERLRKPSKPGNLAKHFGKLKREIDGLQYQISSRENED